MIKRILTLALSLIFELSLSGVKVNSSYAASAKEECDKTPGKVWNYQLNSCVKKQDQIEIEDKVKNACTGLTGDDFNNCYYKTAKEASSDITSSPNEKNGHQVAAGASATISLLSAWFLLKNKNAKCGTSMGLMLSAGLANVAGEVYVNLTYKNKLKKEIDSYKEDIKKFSDTSKQEDLEVSSDNQVRAFDFLINQEKHKKEALKIRGGMYAAVSALYYAAATFAVIEAAKPDAGFATSSCPGLTMNSSPANEGVLPPMGSRNYLEMLLSNLMINNSYADEKDDSYLNTKGGDILSDFTGILTGAGIGLAAQLAFKNTIKQALTYPVTRGAFSAVLGGYTTYLSVDSFKKVKESQKRIDELEEIKKGMIADAPTVSGCTVEDRNNSAKPTCYCYTEGSQKNMARQNQAVCKAQWGNPDLAWGNNETPDWLGNNGPKTCVSSAYLVDEGCSCKSTNGKSTCLKIKTPGGFADIGATSWGNGLTGMANNIFSDNYGGGELLAGSGNKLAMMSKKINEGLKKDPKMKKVADQMAKLEKKYANSKAFKNMPSALLASYAPSNNSLKDIEPTSILDEAEKEIKKLNDYESNDAKTASTPKNHNFDLDFSENDGIQVDDMDEAMNENFDYGDNDINNRPQDSLFDILTLRYRTSGLKRLFEEDLKN